MVATEGLPVFLSGSDTSDSNEDERLSKVSSPLLEDEPKNDFNAAQDEEYVRVEGMYTGSQSIPD